MRKWELGRYTLTQLCNALDYSDPADPHSGNAPIRGPSDLAALFDDLGWS